MIFLDINVPQSAAQVRQALDHEGAQGFAFYLTAPNHRVGWDPAIVRQLLAWGYEGMSIWEAYPATGSGAAEGAQAASETLALGCTFAALAIEAGLVGHRAYCAGWGFAARAVGVVTVGYSTPAGIRSDLYDFDRSWAAIPGNCDPAAAPGTPGLRAVQCGSGSFAGVSYDVDVSEYTFSVPQAKEADMPILVNTSEGVFIWWGSMYEHVDDPDSLGKFQALVGVQTVGPVDDGMHQLLKAGSSGAIAAELAAMKISGSWSVSGTLTGSGSVS